MLSWQHFRVNNKSFYKIGDGNSFKKRHLYPYFCYVTHCARYPRNLLFLYQDTFHSLYDYSFAITVERTLCKKIEQAYCLLD